MGICRMAYPEGRSLSDGRVGRFCATFPRMKNHDLSRRAFLAMAGAMPFATSLGTGLLAQTKKVPVGIELYSVRGELTKDLKGTVTAIAKMGYEVVEFYSPYLNWTTEQPRTTASSSTISASSACRRTTARRP